MRAETEIDILVAYGDTGLNFALSSKLTQFIQKNSQLNFTNKDKYKAMLVSLISLQFLCS
jgi:type IV pilus biogenesis protein CpaD/CtpE